MALLGQIASGAGAVGAALSIVDQLIQSQISITDIDGNDVVYLNVTDSEQLDMSVDVTEHPVADLGGIVDYVSRRSIPLTIQATITNRNYDLRRDPVGALLSRAAAFAPQVFAAVNTAASVASKFFDLGTDQNTRTLQLLHKWQRFETLLKVNGAKLDYQKIANNKQDVYFILQNCVPVSDPSYGADGLGLQLTFKNILYIKGQQGGGLQGIKGFIEKFISIPRNPFG